MDYIITVRADKLAVGDIILCSSDQAPEKVKRVTLFSGGCVVRTDRHDHIVARDAQFTVPEAKPCVGCFMTGEHAPGCPTGQNGTPNYE